MANNIVTLDELDDLFADFIQSKLNLPADKVLISYSKRGQISSKYGENVCYIKFFNSPDEVSIYKNRRGKFKSVVLWCQADLGTCRIKPMFMTDGSYEMLPIEDINIIIDREESAF